MKKIFYGFLFLLPVAGHASGYVPTDEFSLTLNSFALWVSVAVAVVATASVFWDARQIKGGVLGKIYNYFGIGMLLILLGFVVLIYKPWNIDFVFMSLHDILYILGYLIVAVGAKMIIKEYKQ